jgi:hypothetical protein
MILERTIEIIQNPMKIYMISILEVHVFVYFHKKTILLKLYDFPSSCSL